jgi:hypothetical protein
MTPSVGQWDAKRDERWYERKLEATYIRMSSDLLNGRVIEMPRVTQEAIGDVVCVLETLKDIGSDGELRAFSKLCSDVLALSVDVLHPAVVV